MQRERRNSIAAPRPIYVGYDTDTESGGAPDWRTVKIGIKSPRGAQIEIRRYR